MQGVVARVIVMLQSAFGGSAVRVGARMHSYCIRTDHGLACEIWVRYPRN